VEVVPPALEGFAVCEAIKQDPTCARTRVMLVLPSVALPDTFARIAACRCDAAFGWPAAASEVYAHLAEILALPVRKARRTRVQLRIALRAGDVEVPAEVQDVSPGGLCVLARTELDPGTEVVVSLGDREAPVDARAKVAWSRPDEEGQVRFGLEFLTLSPETQAHIGDLALWDLHEEPDGTREVSLHGRLDETACLDRLLARLAGSARIAFDMSEVEAINSAGVRNWYRFLSALGAGELLFRRCSVAFTLQACMMPGMTRMGQMTSVKAPYECDRCGQEVERLLDLVALRDGDRIREPTFPCPCGWRLVLDDMPERYFAFLRGQGT
jgi:hypothetical protein